jgi:hypothetical protein
MKAITMPTSTSPLDPIEPNGMTVGPQLATGTVCGRAGAWFFVRRSGNGNDNRNGNEHRDLRAQLAPSCLLQPEDGELVLLCLTPELSSTEVRDGMPALPCRQHILAVLSRVDADRSSVLLPGGVRLATQADSLRIEGREIELAATAGLKARTPQLTVDAVRADLRFGHVNASAGSFIACIGELQLLARKLSTQVDRLLQKARNSFRTVEELDDLRAGRTRWEVDGHAQLHARQTTLLAEGVVKIDGQRIDLG